MSLQIAIQKMNTSSFHIAPDQEYSIHIRNLEETLKSFDLHVAYDKHKTTRTSLESFFKDVIPGFQRENNKWSLSMKQKFVENVFCGFKTTIQLFALSAEDDAQVIDGLQRLTAILEFLNSEYPIFDDVYYKDLENQKGFRRPVITVKVFIFKEWKDVGRYYVDMNENITHSPEDIQKAKDWFMNEKNIVL